jgi:hypothetical protein
VAAGTLGIGGGVANQLGGAADTWPTKYTALGMRPDVSAAVAAAMALLAATTATLQYLVAGLIGWSATQALASYLAPSPGRGPRGVVLAHTPHLRAHLGCRPGRAWLWQAIVGFGAATAGHRLQQLFRRTPRQKAQAVLTGAALAGLAAALLGINPIVTLEKQLLNMIGNLV